MGSLSSTLALVWPVKGKQLGSGTLVYEVDLAPGTKPQLLTVCQPEEWDAMPLEFISPLRQAVECVVRASGVAKLAQRFGGTPASLVCMPTGSSEPLLTCVAKACDISSIVPSVCFPFWSARTQHSNLSGEFGVRFTGETTKAFSCLL